MTSPAPPLPRTHPTARRLPAASLPLAAFATLALAAACGGIAVVDVDAGVGGSAAATNASGTGTTDVAVSSSSGGGVDCEGIAQQYLAAMELLKTCDENGEPSQCSLFTNDSLVCPCLTSINVNAPELQVLDELLAEWENAHCGDDIECPAIACPDIQGSGCVNGKCTDFGPD